MTLIRQCGIPFHHCRCAHRPIFKLHKLRAVRELANKVQLRTRDGNGKHECGCMSEKALHLVCLNTLWFNLVPTKINCN